jgi:hypothetical protein
VSLGFISGWGERFDDIDISVDGERVALLRYQGATSRLIDFQGRLAYPVSTDSVFVRAGQRRLTAAFVRKMDGPYEDLIRPNDWSLTGTEASYGTTSLPHIMQMTVQGPFDAAGVSETAARRGVFTCRPVSADEARPCAQEIVERLATEAYRRPLEQRDIDGLMYFYDEGARRAASSVVCVRPSRRCWSARTSSSASSARRPASGRARCSRSTISTWLRGCRSSCGAPGPDQQLREVAARGQLNNPRRSSVRRCACSRIPGPEALATRFASLWLRLQDLERVKPDAFWFPNYSHAGRDGHAP